MIATLFKGFDSQSIGSEVNDAVGGREWGTPRYFEKLDVLTYVLSELVAPDQFTNTFGLSPYHIFARMGNATECLICLKFGIDANLLTPGDTGNYPSANALHIASQAGKINVV